MSGGGKVAWRHTALAALFFGFALSYGRCPSGRRRKPSAYPRRSLLRRDLAICSTSQNIHTKAAPKPTTTPKNSNVRPGTVNMVNIRETMQAVYQRVASKSGPGAKIHRGRWNPSRLSGPQL
jgi:hypothetical protein